MKRDSTSFPTDSLSAIQTFFSDTGFLAMIGMVCCLTSCGDARIEGAETAQKKKDATIEKPANVFPPQVAGGFYPGDVEELQKKISIFFDSSPRLNLRGLRAVIVPHAGYQYSGAVAAQAFREVPATFKTAIILADNHHPEARYTGVSFPEAGAMAVPGGEIPLSEICWQLAEAAPDLFCHDPHAHNSHVVEVELPFLLAARQWPEKQDFEIVPLVLGGDLSDEQIGRLADLLDAHANEETLFVISTDLSHFQPEAAARQIDGVTISRILAKEGDQLPPGSCCGLQSVRTLLKLAQRRGWESNLLSYDNSATTSGDKQRVVGYTAAAFTEPLSFTAEEEKAIAGFARQVVETKVRTGEDLVAEAAWLDRFPVFRLNRAVFVTIEKEGDLRGCIGGLVQLAPIHESVRQFALAAALRDNRFAPVVEAELAHLTYSVSILTFPSRLQASPESYAEVLETRRPGAILEINGRQSTFLPSVWKQIPDPVAFLSALSEKQGAAPDAWKSPGAILHLYDALVLHE